MEKAKMTAVQARTFDRYSVGNAVAVKTALKCGCEPYEDVFTYVRWKAMGFQVQRGEHAIKLPMVKHVVDEDPEDGDISVRKLLTTSCVFCRHQVAAIGGES